MAANQIILKIPMSSIKSSDSYSTKYNSTYLQASASANNEAATDYTTKEWAFTFPRMIVPTTFVLTAFKIPLQIQITAPDTDGISFAIQVNNTQYSIDSMGNVTDSNFFSYINNYISQYRKLPIITFVAGSWILKPSSSTYNYVKFCFAQPELIGTVENGGTQIFRPTADIDAGHWVPDGYSGVYQLINESTADDDTTSISSYGEGTTGPDIPADQSTSTVKVDFSLPNAANLIQLRLFTRAKVSRGGSAHVYTTVRVNEKSAILKLTHVYTSTFFDIGNYNTYELVLDSSSPLIKEINSYYNIHNEVPSVEIDIETYADGYDHNYDEKTEDASCSATQVYLESVYGATPLASLYAKSNGTWSPGISIYEKQNGAWVEISENETKTILSSKLVIDKCAFRGHKETPIADIKATCINTGMTGGMKCSYCGKIVKEHDTVVPALGHDYRSDGKCNRCYATSPDIISFTIQRNTQESATTYNSMPNLTWGEWVRGYWQITSDGSVRYYLEYSTSITDYTIDGVKSTDLIIAGHAYTATDATTV